MKQDYTKEQKDTEQMSSVRRSHEPIEGQWCGYEINFTYRNKKYMAITVQGIRGLMDVLITKVSNKEFIAIPKHGDKYQIEVKKLYKLVHDFA